MFIFRRFLTLAAPLALFGGLAFVARFPERWWLVAGLASFVIFGVIWDFSKRRWNSLFLNFLLTPLILFLTTEAFLLIIEGWILYYTVAAAMALLLAGYFHQSLNYFYFNRLYRPQTFEIFGWYLNLFSGAFLFLSSFAAIVLLNLPVGGAAVIVYLVLFVLVYEIFWNYKFPWSASRGYNFVLPLVLAELFLGLSYLPVSFFVNGIILAIGFYLLIGLARLALMNQLEKKSVVYYLLVSGVSAILILLTAKWI